jgi:putative transferase (TIGR04331 family)
MKTNFIVSVYPKTWKKNYKKLFLAEPYVYQLLQKQGKLKNFDSITIIPHLRSSREDLIRGHNFVYEKYLKYVPLLTDKLNKIHNVNYSSFFWQKSLSLSLVRHITFLYDMFMQCESLDTEIHDCSILSEKSYYIPKDFNDHRDFIQTTGYGQEQIFSIYIHLFYPSKFDVVTDKFTWPNVFKSRENRWGKNLFDKILRITPLKLFGKAVEKVFKVKDPQVVIVESFFSTKNLIRLILKSRGRVRPVTLNSDFKISNSIDLSSRKQISSITGDVDNFDRFFFASLEYCFPRIFIEDFKIIFHHYSNYFSKFQNIKYVVNETWIGNNYSSIAIAILQNRGIKHINNEHNYISHHFLGNNNKYLFPLVDKFVTLGWFDENIPNLVKGSSLYSWYDGKRYIKEHLITYITGIPPIKTPEISAAYGDFGSFNAEKHLEFVTAFFNNLKITTLNNLVYRGYPIDAYAATHVEPQMVRYDQDFELKEYLKHVKNIDYTAQSAKLLMKKSRLVIVDYLSTSYLEAILVNVPTVFFWNMETYYLEEKYANIYEPLISAGICQTNPVDAAEFIESIKHNPEEWWEKESVQRARNLFLSQNFGSETILENYILLLSK